MRVANLYILAGQSNASGARTGDADHLPDDDLDASIKYQWHSPAVYVSQQLFWGPLKAIPNRQAFDYFGPEISLARGFARLGQNVAIFKYASPGLPITDWGEKGEGRFYDQMSAKIVAAIESLHSEGLYAVVSGLFWIQGESDAKPSEATRYKSRLKSLISSLRYDLRSPRLPVVLGLQENHRVDHPRLLAEIVDAQSELAAEDRRIIRSSMHNLEWGDRYGHLTPAGILDHGTRLLDDYRRLPLATTSGLITKIEARTENRSQLVWIGNCSIAYHIVNETNSRDPYDRDIHLFNLAAMAAANGAPVTLEYEVNSSNNRVVKNLDASFAP